MRKVVGRDISLQKTAVSPACRDGPAASTEKTAPKPWRRSGKGRHRVTSHDGRGTKPQTIPGSRQIFVSACAAAKLPRRTHGIPVKITNAKTFLAPMMRHVPGGWPGSRSICTGTVCSLSTEQNSRERYCNSTRGMPPQALGWFVGRQTT